MTKREASDSSKESLINPLPPFPNFIQIFAQIMSLNGHFFDTRWCSYGLNSEDEVTDLFNVGLAYLRQSMSTVIP